MTWSTKRKFFYIGGFIIILLFFLLLILQPRINKASDCFDGIQNGSETGVDCGGSCLRFCADQALDLSTRWSRVFRVIPGRYNVAALVENQNQDAAIARISYEFRLYDENNIFIARRSGATYIPPNGRFLIFEPAISTGDRIAVRSDFTFTQRPDWLQVFDTIPNISVSGIRSQDIFLKPQVTAVVTNTSTTDLYDIDVAVIVYDEQENVLTTSFTFIEELSRGLGHEVFFTWQEPFSEAPARIEVLPFVNVYTSKRF